MKKYLLTFIATIAIVSFGSTSITNAQTANAPVAEEHDHNHAEAQKAETKKDSSGPGMMGGMNMENMHAMMDQCMKNHKDGKMCDHQMMEECQSKMDKGECQKMMKKMKKQKK